MIFKDWWILFFIPIVLGGAFLIKTRSSPAAFRFSSNKLFNSLNSSWKIKMRFLPDLLRLIVIILFVLALAGPRLVQEKDVRKTEGIDIVLAIDSSGSMAAEDFKINNRRMNRLEIIKRVVGDFIEQREHDRIGLVTFAGLAYTVCPLTTDYSWLAANLERIDLGLITDGTAVGSAIASSIARLKQSDAKSKVIILLTDGMNNAGKVDPVEAARAAAAMGIKIYTIGAGSKGYVPFPAKDFFGRDVYQQVLIDLDEDTLKEIARLTDGKYFRATNTESLKEIYGEIDALEKTEIEEFGYYEYTELFYQFLMAALLLLLTELVLANTLLLKVP